MVDFDRGNTRVNLNDVKIENHDGPDVALESNFVHTHDAEVIVHFRDIEESLVANIKNATFVVGCVAWLTSARVLEALANVELGCSIVVQKEDFLRPDGESSKFKEKLRNAYSKLHVQLNRRAFPGLVSHLSVAGDESVQPVRCVGNLNWQKSPAFPRMHNKFLVFCHFSEMDAENGCGGVTPYAVWTGSYNMTENATRSLENCVYIQHEEVANAFMTEYEQIMALSEPLDWDSEWMEPEWRIGT